MIRELATLVLIDCLEHSLECSLQGADETRRLDIGHLGLFALLAKVLDFAYVESRNERIDLVALLINETCKFEFRSQMQNSLNFKLLLEQLVDPRLYSNN